MELPSGIPPDKDKQLVLHQKQQQQQHQQQQKSNLTLNLPISPATSSTSLTSAGQHQQQQQLSGLSSTATSCSASHSHPHYHQQTIEKLSRPLAFDKMEALVREMQDSEAGVPVRQQKIFLTSIPYAFMGYDLIEWLMDRLNIEESEALSISNQLCLHGYFFPVNDTKTLVVKDDSSLYRFQTPYYWPWQHKAPDNVEYAIYLAKRSLRNKQRHALEDYEAEALASLHKNLKGKWDFISMQAEEQVRLAKERKKGDKIVGDSQERAFWRVHRPPPGQFTPLEPCPVPSRDRQGIKPKKKTIEDVQREVDYLNKSLNRTRMKMSQACELLVNYSETFVEYDFFLRPVLPSNPWVTDDITFWQLNNTFVEIPTEKRVKRWAISVEELVTDPTGLNEFTTFLEKEYSHENIRFWIAVNRLRRSAQSQVPRRVNEIYEEFLKPGAPCEINIDGKTMEIVQKGLKSPSRFTFDAASDHIYTLLLKKDCYPRFIRSDHYKNLLATGIQPSHKKRFFNFGGVGVAKKKMTAALSSQQNLGGSTISSTVSGAPVPPAPGSLARRRGSDRSLTGSAHELAIIGTKETPNKVPHSHSQSNLSEVPYREGTKTKPEQLAVTKETSNSSVCPWDVCETDEESATAVAPVHVSVCPWDQEDNLPPAPPATPAVKTASQRLASTSSDTTDISDRTQKTFGIRQHTVDSGESSSKRLIANFSEHRRASMSFTSGPSEPQFDSSPKITSKSLANTVMDTGISPVHSPSHVKFSTPSSTEDEITMLTKLAITDCTLPIELSESKPPSLRTTPPTNIDQNSKEILNQVHLQPNDSEATMSSDEIKTPRALTPTIQVHECSSNDILQTEIDSIADVSMIDKTSATAAITSVVAVVMPTMDILSDSNLHEEVQLNETVSQRVTISSIPPPLPLLGPMEEEEQILEEEESLRQEELSPTTDEYQEGSHFDAVDRSDAFDYEIGNENSTATGCIAPAPTPAPCMAPLAEMDVDPVEDEIIESVEVVISHKPIADTVIATDNLIPASSTVLDVEETKKKRKKRSSDTKKISSFEDKEKEKEKNTTEGGSSVDHNTVCPWEDENVTSDGTFVKTYATLGYL